MSHLKFDTDGSLFFEWIAAIGFDNQFTFEFVDTDGEPFNIEDYTFSIQIWKEGSTTNVLEINSDELTNNGVLGTFTGVINDEDSELFKHRSRYVGQVKVVYPDSTTHKWYNFVYLPSREIHTNTTTNVSGTINVGGVTVSGSITIAGGASSASQVSFTPAQGIAATNVQAAIEEVVTDGDVKLALKANIASPTFTTQITSPVIYGSAVANGDITIEGTAHATKTTSYVILQPTGGNVGIGTTTPAVQFNISGYMKIGTTGTTYAADIGGGNVELGPAIYINRTLNAGGTNEHGIIDRTTFSGTTYAYNPFDSQVIYTAGSYNHYSGFQQRAQMLTGVTVTDYYSHYSASTLDNGSTTTNHYHFLATDLLIGNSATVTNNYGLRVNTMKGTNKWGVYVQTDRSYFGGGIGIGADVGAGFLLTLQATTPVMTFNQSTTQRGVIGVAGVGGGIVTGSAQGDFVIRSESTSIRFSTDGGTSIRASFTTNGLGIGVAAPTARIHLAAGTTSASTAPIKLTTGTVMTTAEAGAMEYNNTFHLTNSDATRRHVVLAPNTTKITAAAPYTNDAYIVMNIGGTDFKVMTTA